MQKLLAASVLFFASFNSPTTAQQVTTQSSTTESGATREVITRFSEDSGTFIPLYVKSFRNLRADTLGTSVHEHCAGQAGLKMEAYRKKGADIEVVEKSEESAFYIATLGATTTLKERAILIYCDGSGTLVVGVKVDPATANQMRPVEQYVRETQSGGNSSTTTTAPNQSQGSVNININSGGGSDNK